MKRNEREKKPISLDDRREYKAKQRSQRTKTRNYPNTRNYDESQLPLGMIIIRVTASWHIRAVMP